MAINVRNARTHEPYIPAYPSTGASIGGFPKKGDLVYKSSDLYTVSSSDTAGSTLGAILGIVSIVSTSTSTLGYIEPVTGKELEIDFSTDWSTAVATSTNIGRYFRVSYSTVYGTVLDLSTGPQKDLGINLSSDLVALSSNKELFYLTGLSVTAKKAYGRIPTRCCYF